jgi:hypothetical protein
VSEWPNNRFRPSEPGHWASREDRGGVSLRQLLFQRASYRLIAAAAASGRLTHFPVRLFEHVGDVYRRVETAADDDFAGIAQLRLAALVHEEPSESLPNLLASADVLDFAPTVVAVTGGFGRIWKVQTDGDLRAYVETHRPHLPAILLFEVAHEGQSTALMARAAELAGLRTALTCWAARLAEQLT